MWKLAKQHKKEIFAHVSDVILCGGVFAASILSFRYRDILWGPWVGIGASILLLFGAFFLFFLNVSEAEIAFKQRFPSIGGWSSVIVCLVYAIPMAQLFLVVALSGKS